MIRAALYERVSTEEQALHGYSIQAQVDALTDYCTTNQIKIVGHYTDEGISAGLPVMKRPALVRLLNDIEAGKIDMVLFTKLDRWFRNVKEYYKTQDVLDRHHVTWKTIMEDYDTSTANGSFMVTVMLGIAQQQRIRTSERIKVVFDNKIRKGEAIMGRVPLGYIKTVEGGRPVLRFDPATHDAVAAFWACMISTGNMVQARRRLQDLGIYRSYTQVNDMLRRSKFYTGNYRGVTDYCPAYLSPAQLDDILSHRVKKSPRGRVYLFAGLIRCPVCGCTLKGCFGRRRHTDGTIMETLQMRCSKHLRDPRNCTWNHTISQAKLQAQLLTKLDQYIHDAVARVDVERRRQEAAASRTLPQLRERLRRTTQAYIAGGLSDDDYKAAAADLNAQIKKAEQDTPAPLPDDAAIKRLTGTDFRSIYSGLSVEERQSFWHQLISAIHLDDTKIVSVDFRL